MNCSSFSRCDVRVGLAVTPLDVGDHAFVGGPVRALAAVPVLVPDVDLLVAAVQQHVALLLRQRVGTGCRGRCRALRRRPRARGSSTRAWRSPRARARPRSTERSGSGTTSSGSTSSRVPSPSQVGTGAVRRVEREVARGHLVEREAAVGAGERLREVLELLGPVVGLRPRSTRCPRRARARSRSNRRRAGGCRAWRRAGRRRPRSCACRSSGAGSARRARGPRRRCGPAGSPCARARRAASRTRPCGPGRPAPAPGSGCPRAAPAPGRRSDRASAGRSDARSCSSADGRRGRTAPAGSRRPR